MRAPRFFVLTGAPHAGAIRDRAAAHGAVGRVVAHGTPHPGHGCYGSAEVTPPVKRCKPRCRRFVSTARTAICEDCGADHPTLGPLVKLEPRRAK
jgi:hypothetical protein